MILITTSKTPHQATRRFARALSEAIDYSLYVPRGEKNTFKLIELARNKGLPHAIIITEEKMQPSQIRIIDVKQDSWEWNKKTIKIEKADEKQLLMIKKKLLKL